MEFIKQSIADVILLKPKVHSDHRGYFFESFSHDKFEEAIGFNVNFCQDNESSSTKGVLRGLHFQLPPYAQSKLVRVIDGLVLDVAVDIRQGSPTFGKHVSVLLSGENKHQLFIPRGFAHGFLVLSDSATLAYKVDNYYSPDHDRGLSFNDPTLGIDWGMCTDQLKLSSKDLKQPNLMNINNECLKLSYEYNLYG